MEPKKDKFKRQLQRKKWIQPSRSAYIIDTLWWSIPYISGCWFLNTISRDSSGPPTWNQAVFILFVSGTFQFRYVLDRCSICEQISISDDTFSPKQKERKWRNKTCSILVSLRPRWPPSWNSWLRNYLPPIWGIVHPRASVQYMHNSIRPIYA